jgi:hypothetical protein
MLETLHPTAVPIVHNTAAVAELEHGMNTAADHATPSAQFAGKWGQQPGTSTTDHSVACTTPSSALMLLQIHGVPVLITLGCQRPVLSDDILQK